MRKLLLSLLLIFILVPSVYAAPTTLSLDPITITTSQDETFNIDINIFSENDPIASTDIVINYDNSLLEPITSDIQNGDLFKTVDAKIISPGKLYIYGVQENKHDAKPARGTVATIQFKALKNGSTTLEFDCNDSSNNTSQIIKFNSNFENIINCNATNSHISSISISESSVLGAFTDNYSGFSRYTFLLGSVVVIFTCYIIVKYSRLHKDIS